MLWHSLLFPCFSIFRLCLCLRFAGLPGDGGWYELKWNVTMVSVTLGDCKQGLQWRWEEVWWVVGGRHIPSLGWTLVKGTRRSASRTHFKESKSVIKRINYHKPIHEVTKAVETTNLHFCPACDKVISVSHSTTEQVCDQKDFRRRVQRRRSFFSS